MDRERMGNLEILLRRILPQVLPCPRSMAMDALQMLAVDFCKESGVWTATFQETVCPCDTTISPPLPKGAAIASVISITLDGEKLEGNSFEVGTRDISLHEAPQSQKLAIVNATLRPLRMSSELPEDILEEYGDILAFGAIAKIKAMSGQSIEWTDPSGMQVYYQLYSEGCSKAKARKFRKRLGSGVLYVNTEDV